MYWPVLGQDWSCIGRLDSPRYPYMYARFHSEGRASFLLRFIFSTFGTNYEALLPPTHYHPSPVSKDNGNVGEEEVESTVMILVRIFGVGWEVIRLPNWCIKWKI